MYDEIKEKEKEYQQIVDQIKERIGREGILRKDDANAFHERISSWNNSVGTQILKTERFHLLGSLTAFAASVITALAFFTKDVNVLVAAVLLITFVIAFVGLIRSAINISEKPSFHYLRYSVVDISPSNFSAKVQHAIKQGVFSAEELDSLADRDFILPWEMAVIEERKDRIYQQKVRNKKQKMLNKAKETLTAAV